MNTNDSKTTQEGRRTNSQILGEVEFNDGVVIFLTQ